MKRFAVLLAGLSIPMLTLASPAAAAAPKPDPPSAHHVPNFPEQPDTNPGADDKGCASISGHPGVTQSVSHEAAPADDIRGALYIDACVLGGSG
jgi:hypothetical protein